MKTLRMMVLTAFWLAVTLVSSGATLAERWSAPENAAFRAAHVPGARLLVLVSAEGVRKLRCLLPELGSLAVPQEQRRLMQWLETAAKFGEAHRFEMAMLTACWQDGKADKIERISIALKFQEPVKEEELRILLLTSGQPMQKKDGIFQLGGADAKDALALQEGGRVLVYAETVAQLRELEANMRAGHGFAGMQLAHLPPQECLLYADLEGAWCLDKNDGLRDIMVSLGIVMPSAVALGVDGRSAVCRLVCQSPEDAAIFLGALQVAEIVGRQILVSERQDASDGGKVYGMALAGMERVRLARTGAVTDIRYDGDLLQDCLPVMKKFLALKGQTDAMNDMRQLELAFFMFADDSDDVWPKAETWQKDLRPYLPETRVELGHYRYYGNGRKLKDAPKPSTTVLLVDTVPHGGKFIVGFWDGHVEALEGTTIEDALQKRGAIVSPQPR